MRSSTDIDTMQKTPEYREAFAQKMRSTPVVVALALLATFLWGTAYPCIKIGFELFAVDTMAEQMIFAGVRFIGAGILLLLYCGLTQRSVRLVRRDLPGVGLLGLVMTTLQYVFYYVAIFHVSGTKGAIINSSSAFLGVIFAHFLVKGDRMTTRKAIGCAVGFSGVIVINLGGAMGGFSLLGDGAMLLATSMFALGGIISKTVTRTVDSALATGWQLTFGGMLLWLIGWIAGGRLNAGTPVAWVLLGYMMMLSAVAFSVWALLFRYNPPAKISVYTLMVPVFGVLCSGIFLHEPVFKLRNFVALALIVSGIWVVNRPRKQADDAKIE